MTLGLFRMLVIEFLVLLKVDSLTSCWTSSFVSSLLSCVSYVAACDSVLSRLPISVLRIFSVLTIYTYCCFGFALILIDDLYFLSPICMVYCVSVLLLPSMLLSYSGSGSLVSLLLDCLDSRILFSLTISLLCCTWIAP